ncbi:hypothetical protein [Actinoplanes teichomyceticus]|uniref:Uncharacterized protein n=1 Tax=Actinoplanes teichomyceticus TaxID=1867 RepID=A0A561VG91_ACTTI|nr:hypothetical protein [Actinoplanes teichomyceticus]TWG10640.1 hypothetical protein FHX34_107132 [Actinoplanes teichomyceticus]GIF15409.1 hypothetical protein Ate01nite_54410 [Actinoplanes teichomyceticus]
MTDPGTGPSAVAPAPHRRRPIVVALGVLAAVVLALAAWAWTRPAPETAMRDRALAAVLAGGGPAGWAVAGDPDPAPEIEGVSADAVWTDRDGQPVLLDGDGFTVLWSVSPATPRDCTALAVWARDRIAPEAAPDVTASCPAAIGGDVDEPAVIAAHGTEPGANGRYLFSASVVPRSGRTALFAGLTYEGPDTAR